MLIRLLLLFILIVAAELALLLWLTQQTGFLVTVLVILGTGVLGASLARWQGLRAWNAIRSDIAAGRMPAASVVDGVMILLSGAFLLAPGLISDICGCLLLIPRIRTAVSRVLIAYFTRRLGSRLKKYGAQANGFTQGEVIDAEFRRTDIERIEDRAPK
jgi:UPF0716 protein FxsA